MSDHSVDLEPDAIVAQLMSEDDASTDLVALVGFLGEGLEGHCRLYATPELRTSIDIPIAAIVHRHRIEQDELGGRSVIWVKAEAMQPPPVAEPAQDVEAKFLAGPLASGIQLRGTSLELAKLLGFRSALPILCADPQGRSKFCET
jgi:hypothetical protein